MGSEMCIRDRYTAGEIGKLLHKNTNTVYTWLERARKLLKTQLEGGDCHG